MTDPRTRLAVLAGRYAIEGELGRGGMAIVYRARDLRHDRLVAIKAMRPEIEAALGAERFLRETRIAARLSHPNILPVYDSGVAEGTLYYVMPLVGGGTLRMRLARERQLPLADALQIAREVAEALTYAHSQGVVHRDIKPENILLEAGRVRVTDFGIARAFASVEAERLTASGISIGTPGYMSPEQATGSPLVDGRSDLYSLGCVVYEMLAGHPPFLGTSLQEIVARHALDPVPRLRTERPNVPPSIERAVMTALAKVPADRFATCREFTAALEDTAPTPAPSSQRRRLVVILGLFMLAIAAGLLVRSIGAGRKSTTGPSGGTSVAVLPFTNVNGDSAGDYLSDGITEDLLNDLARRPELHVVARTSAFVFKGKAADARVIGTQLRVENLVEGSVRRLRDSLHVTARLIQTTNGYSTWSARFDRPATALFALEADLTQGLSTALGLPGGASLATSRGTQSVAAYTAYLRGRFLFNRWEIDDERAALANFQAAITIDPGFAAAYSGLADAYYSLSGRFLAPDEALPKARAAARRAIALDSTLGEAYVSLADIQAFADWDWVGAEQSLQRAVGLLPQYATAHHHYGMLLCYLRRFDQAAAELDQARRLDPLSPSIEATAVWPLYLDHQYDAAIAALEKLRVADTSFIAAHSLLGTMYLLKHDYPTAARELQAYLAREYTPYYSAMLALAFNGQGRRREAQAILDSLQHRSDPEASYSLSVLYAGLGKPDRALDWLEATYERRNEDILWAAVDPLLDGLRSQPRFRALMKRLPNG